ncbi:MAG: bifunctional acetate--CoA ligase family protein/GNAT family N-acetyltransferase [Chlamydiales bacterium]|nr:bifunctional acetate--CoA ligase family protein/GNAT family N-acetyltransferase [Chlamydiales bacterium]
MHTDPLQNVYDSYPHPLDALFLPKTVAVIGAKDTIGSVGRTLLLNLQSSAFTGKIFAVNPKRSKVLGITCYPSIKDIPEKVDLAILVTPASTIPNLVKECLEAGVSALIIISAGFKELGTDGIKLEAEILANIRNTPLRIIGPNCLGIMNPSIGLNASFAKGMALPGNIAFMSQSGAMCTAVLDWSLQEHVGFSAFISIGSMIDVNWGDLIRYFGSDLKTESILIYMETIGDPRSFLSAAREVALDKPIIVIKPGRTQEASIAAASHTGSLTGSDEVFDAALERAGVLRVNDISELFYMADVLGKQARPRGPKLHIVTNAGGPAVLATDAAIMAGAKIPALSDETKNKLNAFLPAAWSHSNPIDILGDADAERYSKTLEVLADDKDSDGVLVILSPQDMTDPTGTAEALRHFAKVKNKPILASWMGGAFVKGGIDLLNKARIPAFSYPDSAAWSFATMYRYSDNLKRLYETPLATTSKPKIAESQEIIQNALKEKRTLLNEYESKRILANFGIPTVETLVAKTADEAVAIANKMGYPIVLKLFSDTITHKSDVGGVRLNLKNSSDVAQNFSEIQAAVGVEHFQGVTVQPMVNTKGIELILGSSCDAQFGPIMLFGSGGVMVEIYKDRALGLPPLNTTLARQMIEKTKIYDALKGFRGQKPVSMKALEEILVAFSLMITELPLIKECDINPLLASHAALIALDARIVLHDTSTTPKLAIRPYPTEYIVEKILKNGLKATIRPIRPEDEPNVEHFHKELSEHSVRQRYFAFKSLDERAAHTRLVRICTNDFDTQIALIAENAQHQIMGIARLTKIKDGKTADLKMIIGDSFHGQGLGSSLVEELLKIAKKEGISTITATMLSENTGMVHILQKLGFTLETSYIYTHATKGLGKV